MKSLITTINNNNHNATSRKILTISRKDTNNNNNPTNNNTTPHKTTTATTLKRDNFTKAIELPLRFYQHKEFRAMTAKRTTYSNNTDHAMDILRS